MSAPRHDPVLLDEALALLAPGAGETAVDATVGLGGHAERIAARIGPTGRIVINDLDPSNLRAAEARLRALPAPPTIETIHGNLADLPRRLTDRGLAADLVLADLGFASSQVDDPARGFSFSRDGPLDMRLDPSAPETAADLVARLPEAELADLIRRFGEERRAGRIAAKLVAARADAPILTTGRLAELVRQAVGPRRPGERIDPATRTFQALRIAVNDEIGSVERFVGAVGRAARSPGRSWLAPGARVAVIAFHSLEDRPVKRAFADLARAGLADALTRKPIRPGAGELDRNPRARSARLRAIRLPSS
ncbi:MAG: 16S rRNA (cytosine(1402)-N(4))-methyltransferase RsmH [Planctomycetota bacterium]|nr:MAG: 16S rRNA (cytosine(1402)-N(4))-methyltransferase RsmH [Planctomycetota bacterium]